MRKINLIFLIFITNAYISFSQNSLTCDLAINNSGGIMALTFDGNVHDDDTTTGNTGGGTCTGFEEKNGLLVIEMENTNFSGNWKKKTTIGSATGTGYIQWEGNQSFNNTANGRIEIPIKINTAGTYEFRWRMAVGNTEFGLTEHNDTWLKIEASNFYADKNGSLIKPKPDCNNAANYACPMGSTIDGFFKMFGGGSTWQWQNKTSDFNDHFVHATFNTPGDYKIIVAARSSSHALDRIVMYNKAMMNRATAENLSNPETNCTNTGGGIGGGSTTDPSDIDNLSVKSFTCNDVVLSWGDVQNDTGYRIRRKTSSETVFTNIADVDANSTTYTDLTVAQNTSYTYMVRPLKDGVAMASSNQLNVAIPRCTVLGIDTQRKEILSIYPNPVTDLVYLNSKTEWSLINSSGQVLETGIGNVVKMTDRTAGLYFIKIKSNVMKVIKE